MPETGSVNLVIGERTSFNLILAKYHHKCKLTNTVHVYKYK